MKQCERIVDLFGELHGDEVDGKTKIMVQDHLYNCPGCREEYKWYALTVQALGSLETVAPPPDFLAKLNARISSEPNHSFSFIEFFRNIFTSVPYMPLPAGVVALALVACIGLVVYKSSLSFMPTAKPEAISYHSGEKVGGLASRVSTSKTTPISTSPAPLLKNFPPTIAESIGADNLTLESNSIDTAIESLKKKILPNIQGKIVGDEKGFHNAGDVVLAVLIPSESYSRLTKELVDHGALAVGVGSEEKRYSPTQKDGNNVLLYIRFVHRR
ncbi:anti-sigma factor family protein [Desulfomonile tiedjei]|uniref:Zinc-finger domain-containing protein n=1 Tax=Desulfomonile tiedjei (strain ATCC 49306 / DSM 6799 / DCB-1) TaxID=706587 RepID=I4C2Y4_DESTA|nr:zf-HC2 domain-containing protein [Desulfomonile tiedjei]AFM23925.1 hypothetical protein Desti_1212 [Desulfomonile tiedjei DSM 6799]